MIHRVLEPRVSRHILRYAVGLGVLAALSLATPADAASPKQARVELYRAGDFVSQTNSVQCVGASMQMMLNIIGPTNDRSSATQARLQRLARSHSPRPFQLLGREFVRPRRGASSFGWAAGLSIDGAGRYRVTSAATLTEALGIAARSIAITKRPVGLLVWHGAHAWVMSGFQASADPLTHADARIQRITVLDPWYPRYSGTYGASPRPGSRLTPSQLSADFLPWHRHFLSPLDGRYVLVLPFDPIVRPAGTPSAV